MRFTTAYRVPYGSTAILRSGATTPPSGANLGRAIVLTQLVLVTLCAARAAVDGLRGQGTVEGGVALALLCAFTIWLVAGVGVRTTRSTPLPRSASPYR
jgi:hypothetical protein